MLKTSKCVGVITVRNELRSMSRSVRKYTSSCRTLKETPTVALVTLALRSPWAVSVQLQTLTVAECCYRLASEIVAYSFYTFVVTGEAPNALLEFTMYLKTAIFTADLNDPLSPRFQTLALEIEIKVSF